MLVEESVGVVEDEYNNIINFENNVNSRYFKKGYISDISISDYSHNTQYSLNDLDSTYVKHKDYVYKLNNQIETNMDFIKGISPTDDPIYWSKTLINSKITITDISGSISGNNITISNWDMFFIKLENKVYDDYGIFLHFGRNTFGLTIDPSLNSTPPTNSADTSFNGVTVTLSDGYKMSINNNDGNGYSWILPVNKLVSTNIESRYNKAISSMTNRISIEYLNNKEKTKLPDKFDTNYWLMRLYHLQYKSFDDYYSLFDPSQINIDELNDIDDSIYRNLRKSEEGVWMVK